MKAGQKKKKGAIKFKCFRNFFKERKERRAYNRNVLKAWKENKTYNTNALKALKERRAYYRND